nr:DUF411 domain-containing protein [uncultured Rhodoferax sp.]
MSARTLSRRRVLAVGLATLALPVWAAKERTRIQVWKEPNCGCCKDWVVHLERAGFSVTVQDSGNTEARKRLGMHEAPGSCHTAEVAGYAIEGHVPAKEIQRLLRDKPQALGLAVPGMPIGSPGMDGAIYQGRKDPCDVLLVAKGGATSIYQSYR